MRTLRFVPALILIPAAAFGQNISHTVQVGDGNLRATVQDGRNYATSMQIGDGNSSVTVQSGRRNATVVVQSGDGLSQSNVQVGENDFYSSTQVQSDMVGSPWSRTNSISSSVGNVTVHFSAE